MADGIKNRLARLEKKSGGDWADILPLIRSGRSYRELTDAQKERYCLYRFGIPREAVEDVERLVSGCDSVDFPLGYASKATGAELSRMIRDTADWLEQVILGKEEE